MFVKSSPPVALSEAGPTSAPATSRLRSVAIVSDAIYPYHLGGKEVRYHNLAKGLANEGIEVHVFTMQWWPERSYHFHDGIHYHSLCRRYALYRGKRRSISQALMFSLACLRLVRHRFDLIEADHMPHLQLFTIQLVAWLRRVPLVVTWHEVWGREYWRRYLGPAGIIAAGVERLTMRLGASIVTPSPGSLERLADEGVPRDKLRLAPNGVDFEALVGAPPALFSYDVLYVGRLIEHKQVHLLLEAIALLLQDGLPLTVAIVGDGPERARLKQLADDLSIASRVEFLGNFDEQTAVFSLMKSAHVLALPSVREGFGVVVAEAIAAGLLVVTTDHPDNHARSLVHDGVTGYQCAPTAASLAAALKDAMRHAEVDPEARNWVREQLSWSACVQSVLHNYHRLLGSRS